MKISFGDRFVNLKKANWDDVRYCYILSNRNMAVYSSTKKSFKKYKEEFRPSDVLIILYKNRRFGFIEFQKKNNTWYIWDIQISKHLQGKGLGTQLLKYIQSVIKKSGGDKIALYVYKKNPVMHLYKNFGFITVKTSKKSNRIKMMKKL